MAAGVTNHLWDVNDLVTLWESYEGGKSGINANGKRSQQEEKGEEETREPNGRTQSDNLGNFAEALWQRSACSQ